MHHIKVKVVHPNIGFFYFVLPNNYPNQRALCIKMMLTSSYTKERHKTLLSCSIFFIQFNWLSLCKHQPNFHLRIGSNVSQAEYFPSIFHYIIYIYGWLLVCTTQRGSRGVARFMNALFSSQFIGGVQIWRPNTATVQQSVVHDGKTGVQVCVRTIQL